MNEQFGRYTLLERIAIGGMAEIFKAKSAGLGGFEKILAIKRLHPRFSQDADFIEMLIDEARITVELSHSNIAQIFDLGKFDDHYYIAMEFIDGKDLYRVMKRLGDRRLVFPLDAAAFIAMEAAAGLDFAHRKKDNRGRPLAIIHRDISPQNILISFLGDVKVVDFGIAKAATRATETESGIIKGKFYYMSPEQAKGERLDHRTDVFSLGILFYEMLTGELLYKDEDDVNLLSRVRRADIDLPSRIRPEIPPDLEDIVMKALARDREDRYPSAQHMQRDLARFLRDYGTMFNKGHLSQLVRGLFEDDAGYGGELIQNRDEYTHDHQSVIARIPEVDEVYDDGSVMELDASIEMLDMEELEVVDDPAYQPAGQNNSSTYGSAYPEAVSNPQDYQADYPQADYPQADYQQPVYQQPAQRADEFAVGQQVVGSDYDSIAASFPGDDPFEAEETRAFDPPPRARGAQDGYGHQGGYGEQAAGYSDPNDYGHQGGYGEQGGYGNQGGDLPRLQKPPAALSPTTPQPAAPANAQVNPRLSMAQQRLLGGGAAPQPAAQPRAVAASPREFGRQPTVIVKNPDPPRPARGGYDQSTSTRRPMVVERQGVITKERLLMGASLLGVVVLSGFLANLFVGEPSTPAEGEQPVVVVNPAGGAQQTTLAIASSPSGAEVKLNGRALYESTPTKREVPANQPLQVEILAEGYQPFKTVVTLLEGQVLNLNPQLEALLGTVAIESEPSGASIYLNGQYKDRTPNTISGVSMKGPVRLRLEKPGYVPKEETISWDGHSTLNVRVSLPSAPSAVASLPPSLSDPPKRRVKKRRPRRRTVKKRPRQRTPPPPKEETPPPKEETPPPPPPKAKGFLSVSASPWGSVYVNGKRVHNETPMLKRSIPAGTYQVYVCYEGNCGDRSSTKSVRVSAERHTVVRF